MSWVIRYLTYPPARRLLRECASVTITEFGSGAESHLRGEIDLGTPLSGYLIIWVIILEVRRQSRRRKPGSNSIIEPLGPGLTPCPVLPEPWPRS